MEKGIKNMAMAVCPVCGMNVNENNYSLKLEYRNQLYRFCSYVCITAFAWHPELFIEEAGEPGAMVIDIPDRKKNFGKEVAS